MLFKVKEFLNIKTLKYIYYAITGLSLENFQCREKAGLKIFEFLGEGEGKRGAVDFFQVRGGGDAEYFLKAIVN